MNYTNISCLVVAFCMIYMPTGYAEENVLTCKLCEAAVQEVESLINFGHNEEAIIGNLTQGCHDAFDEFPDFLRPVFLDLCIGFVNVTVRDIIDLLQDDLEPEQICTMLGLCDSEDFLKLSYVLKTVKESKAVASIQQDLYGPLECKFCKGAVENIEGLIFGNITFDGTLEQEIITQLIQNCIELYPDAPVVEDTCEMVVNTFVKDVMDLLRGLLNPEDICEAIGLCEKPDPVTTMLPVFAPVCVWPVCPCCPIMP